MGFFKKRREAAIAEKIAEIKEKIAEAKQKNADIESREWSRVKTEDMKYLGYKDVSIIKYGFRYWGYNHELDLNASDDDIVKIISDCNLKELMFMISEKKSLDRCMITGMECEVRKRNEMSCTMCNEPIIHVDDLENL